MITLKSIIHDLKEENIDKVITAGWGSSSRSSSSHHSSSSDGGGGPVPNACDCYCCNGIWYKR